MIWGFSVELGSVGFENFVWILGVFVLVDGLLDDDAFLCFGWLVFVWD